MVARAALLLLPLLFACQDPPAPAAGAAAPDLGEAPDLSPPPPFRSALYPAAWTPAFSDAQGRFLHDFSYAGYRRGEAPIPAQVPGPERDVVKDHGADPSGARDSTAAIQAAIDALPSGGLVRLPAGTYRVDGLLTVKRSGVVLRGEGAEKSRLHFTRGRGLSDLANLTFSGAVTAGPLLPLSADGAARSFTVAVADASSLRPGDDVSVGWTISDVFVEEHGMKGIWSAFNGTWRPFFRRTVIAVDTARSPHVVTLDVPLRHAALRRDGAALRKESGYLKECGLEDLGLSNAVAWDDAWSSLRAHAVDLIGVKDCWIRRVKSFAAPRPEAQGYHLQSGGLRVKDGARVTIAEAELRKAQNRGEGGCGYLFEISTSSEVLIRDTVAEDGRHNFIQNWDFGTSGCVFLRVRSAGSRAFVDSKDTVGSAAASEFHHSLAMACLMDQVTVEDAWAALNRLLFSTGAGHTATESVFWNARGSGRLLSYQYGWGYVIGTTGLEVSTDPGSLSAIGTAPEDYREGIGVGAGLDPPSLYEDQLRRRLGR